MINFNAIYERVIELHLSFKDVAEKVGAESTGALITSLEDGTIPVDQVQKLTDLLSLENPAEIFFGKEVN